MPTRSRARTKPCRPRQPASRVRSLRTPSPVAAWPRPASSPVASPSSLPGHTAPRLAAAHQAAQAGHCRARAPESRTEGIEAMRNRIRDAPRRTRPPADVDAFESASHAHRRHRDAERLSAFTVAPRQGKIALVVTRLQITRAAPPLRPAPTRKTRTIECNGQARADEPAADDQDVVVIDHARNDNGSLVAAAGCRQDRSTRRSARPAAHDGTRRAKFAFTLTGTFRWT